MGKKKFDVLVIGAGPGGYVAAIRAAQLGFKTACIEKEKTLGGTCLNVGCIPSKALLQSTEYYEWMQKFSKDHGVEAAKLTVNFSQMQNRKRQVVESLVNGVAGLFKKNGVEWIQGEAQLKDPHHVDVAEGANHQTIEADHLILATGSEAIGLPFLPFDEKKVLSSTGLLSLESIPKKILVIGAGVIGVELASVYRRLGSEIIVIEMLDRITPTMDQAISKMLLQILKKQGLEFHLGAKVLEGKVAKDRVKLTVEEEQKKVEYEGDVVLVAVGRRPYSQTLGLETIGIEKNRQGLVQVDSNFRTNHSNIYAIGDLIEGPMLAHRASEEGMAVAEIIAGQHPHINYMAIPNVIYTHPEVAALGMTESEAREAGLTLKVGTCLFKAIARARCAGDTDGVVKVIGEAQTGRLIGMHILGAHASEMIGEGVMAIEKNATLQEIANASHAHPTLTEGIKEACLQALGRPLHQ